MLAAEHARQLMEQVDAPRRIAELEQELAETKAALAAVLKTQDPKVELDVIRRAYDWTLSSQGEVFGLVEGDMGYDGTGIFLNREHLDSYIEEKIEGWKRVAVLSILPLEALRMAEAFSVGPPRLSPMLRRSIDRAVITTRLALMAGEFPDRDVLVKDVENDAVEEIRQAPPPPPPPQTVFGRFVETMRQRWAR